MTRSSQTRPAAGERAQVVVIGGGPAGSAAATLLARAGIGTVLLEKERFPRFHIGESLMTQTYWVLRKIGMVERLKATDFPRKHSVQFFGSSGKASRPFYFHDHDPHESSATWQVDRAEFDQMMLENAAENGVDVRQGAAVERVLFDGDASSPAAAPRGRAVGVRGTHDDGRPFEVSSQIVVDASGLSSVLARQLGIARKDPNLQKASVYAHFTGAHRDSGIDEGATLILNTRENRGWFWYIPLSRDRVSVGVVGSSADLLKGRGSPREILQEEIEHCPAVRERLENASVATHVHVTGDYTWRSTRCAGDGYVLIGDAFGFIDPVYSSGVLLALKSAELAAGAVVKAFEQGDFSGARLGAFGNRFVEGMEALRKLVYAFYTPGFSFAGFVSRHPQYRPMLVELLTGNVFENPVRDIFNAMGEMCDLPRADPLEAPAP